MAEESTLEPGTAGELAVPSGPQESLRAAAARGDTAEVESLLAAGTDACACDEHGTRQWCRVGEDGERSTTAVDVRKTRVCGMAFGRRGAERWRGSSEGAMGWHNASGRAHGVLRMV